MTWSTGSGNFFDPQNIKWNQLAVSVTTNMIRVLECSRSFFSQSRGRLNVALTRAKQILLVVGHEQTLRYWDEIGCEWIVTVL